MKIEYLNNRFVLCNYILPKHYIEVGQEWAAADGSDLSVIITKIENDLIYYTNKIYNNVGKRIIWNKDHESFQIRYCLVLTSNKIPDSILNLIRYTPKELHKEELLKLTHQAKYVTGKYEVYKIYNTYMLFSMTSGNATFIGYYDRGNEDEILRLIE